MRITDHSFDENPTRSGFCIFWYTQHARGPGYCGQPRESHIGESPQQDGPVRSTVERQQERIAELEAKLKELEPGIRAGPPCVICGLPFYVHETMVGAGDGMGSKFAHQLCWERQRVRELEERVVALEAENLYLRGQRQALMDSERALATRLNHLDTLAREVGERVTRLMGTLDT